MPDLSLVFFAAVFVMIGFFAFPIGLCVLALLYHWSCSKPRRGR